MPARSVSCASSGAKGAVRLSRTVVRIDDVDAVDRRDLAACGSSPACSRWRSRLNFTAAASIFSPSWNLTPWRSLMRQRFVVGATIRRRSPAAARSSASASMSNSLSHSAANTMRPTRCAPASDRACRDPRRGRCAASLRRRAAPQRGDRRQAATNAGQNSCLAHRRDPPALRVKHLYAVAPTASGRRTPASRADAAMQALQAVDRRRRPRSADVDLAPEMAGGARDPAPSSRASALRPGSARAHRGSACGSGSPTAG